MRDTEIRHIVGSLAPVGIQFGNRLQCARQTSVIFPVAMSYTPPTMSIFFSV